MYLLEAKWKGKMIFRPVNGISFTKREWGAEIKADDMERVAEE
jgi:hypothetical protein